MLHILSSRYILLIILIEEILLLPFKPTPSPVSIPVRQWANLPYLRVVRLFRKQIKEQEYANQALKWCLQSGHSLDFFIQPLMHDLWQICPHGNFMMSSSYLNPSIQMGHVLELFFMIRVRTLLTRDRGWGWMGPFIQGKRATSDISLLLNQSTNYFIFPITIHSPFKQKYLPFLILPLITTCQKRYSGLISLNHGRADLIQSVILITPMNKNKEIILENPFHPLDLSPHDLLAIYKRFEESRLINRNPKQELPIQIISQLISSLKGCPPSYIQKCISQALIKETISWNQFLTFLDQQSEVRQKILEWLMYQKTLIQYKEEKQWAIRNKVNQFFQQITYLTFLELTEDQVYILCCIDSICFYLFQIINGKLIIIDQYRNTSEKMGEEKEKIIEEGLIGKDHSKIFIKNDSKIKKPQIVSKNINKTEKKPRELEKNINSIFSTNTTTKLAATQKEDQDQEFYYKKERKNINSLFNIWKDLNLEHSVNYAKVVAPKLGEKNINQTQIGQIKELYCGLDGQRAREKKMGAGQFGPKPLDKAMVLLKDLHRQKRALSYNPYSTFRSKDETEVQVKFKKIQKQRKTRQYSHQSNKETYNPKLRCLAIIYFNMEIVLVKLIKEYNKVALEEQDKVKILTQNQHKKNEIIQSVDFYHHSIVDKWFLIVLIRIQYKNQLRNQNESYIRGYQIDLVENKRRGDCDYKFNSKKETFCFPLNNPVYKKDQLSKSEVFKTEMQEGYGIHFITVNGKYIAIKEDYFQKQVISDKLSNHSGTGSLNINLSCAGGMNLSYPVKNQHVYFTFHHQQRFKNAGLSLSCLSVGTQLNKIVFGTIRGMIIIYDMFSHYFKIKKISNRQIVQLKVAGSLVYILTLDQKIFIMDLVKMELVQHFSVKNQNKLHQKIKKFQISKGVIYCYGTQMRSYVQFVNQPLQHEKRKMETMYKWRLDRLFKEEATYQKKTKFSRNHLQKYMPKNALKNQNSNSASVDMVITSNSYFLVLTDILELIVVCKSSMKIKFTMILAIPYDSKVMKMVLCPKEKLLGLLLFDQNIYIFNIHTQDQYQLIKPSPFFKYTTLCFLDLKNQYLLANGTQAGKIVLSPYCSIPQKTNKILQFHKKNISSLMVVRGECLVSCGQDLLISIWVLPFNILKHEVSLGTGIGYILGQVGLFKQFVYLRSLDGSIVQINSHEGKMVQVIPSVTHWNLSKIDSYTGVLLGITKENRLEKMQKVSGNNWKKVDSYKIDVNKTEVKQLCLVQSQKAEIFMLNGTVIPWSYQGQKFGRTITLYQQ